MSLYVKAITFATQKLGNRAWKSSNIKHIVRAANMAKLVMQFRSKSLGDFKLSKDELGAAAFLYDLLQYSDTSLEDLIREFGAKVATVVFFSNLNATINDTDFFVKSILRLRQDAQLLILSDILDTLNYYAKNRDFLLQDAAYARAVFKVLVDLPNNVFSNFKELIEALLAAIATIIDNQSPDVRETKVSVAEFLDFVDPSVDKTRTEEILTVFGFE